MAKPCPSPPQRNMAQGRIGYAVALAGALLFYLFYPGYLSAYVVGLVVLFPILSLALSLPGMLCTHVVVVPDAAAVVQGGRTGFTVVLRRNKWLPVCRMKAYWQVENHLTGQVRWGSFNGAPHGQAIVSSWNDTNCGWLSCGVTRLSVTDFAGIFSLPRPKPDPVWTLVTPAAQPLPSLPQLLGEGTGVLRPRLGGGPGEDYDLRGYRPGDSMGAVHWKKSARGEDLVVRETLEMVRPTVVISVPLFGNPQTLDRHFARLFALSQALLAEGYSYHLAWLPSGQDTPTLQRVTDANGLARWYQACARTKAPQVGQEIPQLAIPFATGQGAVRYLTLTDGEEAPNDQ